MSGWATSGVPGANPRGLISLLGCAIRATMGIGSTLLVRYRTFWTYDGSVIAQSAY